MRERSAEARAAAAYIAEPAVEARSGRSDKGQRNESRRRIFSWGQTRTQTSAAPHVIR